ncbi:MAG: homoserine dehydrogenase [Eubacterium sp.]|nr:homoserine dehydrogenase [Eubacterium sp.]
MVKVAVLGYGTIGRGVVTVLQGNADTIEKKAGKRVEVKKILDLRDFPGDPNADKVVHDYEEIRTDGEIQIVVECMGGLEPAYTFVKTALQQGRSVATSNKELVAKYGAELIEIAKENTCNFLFEASVGGAIPIIRPLLSCLTADKIEEIAGILNGTTNYMLSKMEREGADFHEVLKEAQAKGYAELHPEADIEGWDACRKIAILTSLAYEKQVDFEDIPTEGITNITAEDIMYAKKMERTIKLIGQSWISEGKVYAMVSPMLIEMDHPLAPVKGVFNAIFVHGNMVDDVMFYGQGAGSLPTASAVAADVVDCVKHIGKTVKINWSKEKLALGDIGGFERKFFVRLPGDTPEDKIRDLFGEVEMITVPGLDEKAFVTKAIKENDFDKAAAAVNVINRIRLH